MKFQEYLERYQREILPPLILDNPDEFYAAFEKGPEALKTFLTDKWEWMCGQLDETAAYPLDFGMDCLALDESESDFTALLTIEFSGAEPSENDAALYASIFFGAAVQPRLFFGEYAEIKTPADTIAIMETHLFKGETFQRMKRAALFQGCNNKPMIFEPPAHSLPVDTGIPLGRDYWYTAYVDEVVKICVKM